MTPGANPWLALPAALLGWLSGALINYLADTLPAERRLAAPACPGCGRKRTWQESLLWPRRCAECGRAACRSRMVITLFTALGLILWRYPEAGPGFALGMLTLVYFGLVAVIDVEHRLILHVTSAAGLLLGLAVGWSQVGLTAAVVGGLAALLIQLGLYFLGGLFGRILGRLRGKAISEVPFGFGDVLLGTVIGLMTGWPEVLRALMITIVSAGLFSLAYLVVLLALRRYRVGTAIPYAPFLIIGAIWILFFT